MRIAKATLAVVQAKIAAPATRVVASLNDIHKVTKERALAIACQEKDWALDILMQWPALSKDRINGAWTDLLQTTTQYTSNFSPAALGRKVDLESNVTLSRF